MESRNTTASRKHWPRLNLINVTTRKICFTGCRVRPNVINLHWFAAGNKRAAYLATFIFLNLNGYGLVASDEEINYLWNVDSSICSLVYFIEKVNWIKEHMHKRDS